MMLSLLLLGESTSQPTQRPVWGKQFNLLVLGIRDCKSYQNPQDVFGVSRDLFVQGLGLYQCRNYYSHFLITLAKEIQTKIQCPYEGVKSSEVICEKSSINKGAGGLLNMHEYPSSNPKNPYKKTDVFTCLYNPNARARVGSMQRRSLRLGNCLPSSRRSERLSQRYRE